MLREALLGLNRKLTFTPFAQHRRTDTVCLIRYTAKLLFVKRPVHETSCHVFFVDNPCPKKQPPVIGYAYYKAINREREKRLTPRLHPKFGINHPVERLCRLYLRKVTPDSWSEDPYIVCLLLSLAQAQSSKQKEKKPETLVFQKTNILIQNNNTKIKLGICSKPCCLSFFVPNQYYSTSSLFQFKVRTPI